MKKPQMAWILTIQTVKAAKTGEKPAPPSSKLCADFYPQALYACIPG
jgi:hypothetical protein